MNCLSGFGVGLVSKIGESIAIPISKQFGYIMHYNKNINNLKNELEKLEGRKNRIQGIVDEDRKNGHQIVLNVQEWLSKVATMEKELQQFFQDGVSTKNRCFGGRCPNLVSRCSLSKKAKKWSANVLSLMEEKFEIISYPAPLPKPKPTFINDIKVAFDMNNLKKFPKLKDLQFRIPVADTRIKLFN